MFVRVLTHTFMNNVNIDQCSLSLCQSLSSIGSLARLLFFLKVPILFLLLRNRQLSLPPLFLVSADILGKGLCLQVLGNFAIDTASFISLALHVLMKRHFFMNI